MNNKENDLAPKWETEVNQWGGVRRFRRVGNVKEYEKEVMIDGIPVPESQLESFHRNNKAHLAKEIEMQKELAANGDHLDKTCPLLCARGVADCSCKKDCVFYGNKGCELRFSGSTPAQDTNGGKCPLIGKCNDSCALYNKGCTLLQFIKIIK